jgi:hypothetical protein
MKHIGKNTDLINVILTKFKGSQVKTSPTKFGLWTALCCLSPTVDSPCHQKHDHSSLSSKVASNSDSIFFRMGLVLIDPDFGCFGKFHGIPPWVKGLTIRIVPKVSL